jgi:hypothetical protein
MESNSDSPSDNHSRSQSGSHRHRRKRSRKSSFFSRIFSTFSASGSSSSGGRKRKKSRRQSISNTIKYRFEEFKTEFTPPERLNRGRIRHEPLGKRIVTRLKDYRDDLFLPRIKKEKLPKPKFSERMRSRMGDVKDDLTFRRLFPKVGDRIPFKAKISYLRETKWKQYKVIFSRDYLIISFNSLIFFITSFYVVHFISQIVTGVVCSFFDIQTVLYYANTEYHFTIQSIIEGQVLMNKWTLLEIIVVFASAPLVCLIMAILLYRLLNLKRIKFSFKRSFKKLTLLFAGKAKRQEYKMEHGGEVRDRKVSIPGYLRLFFIWFICHAFTYFFSGMLFSWLFFMRFGYVTGYIFDSYFFDNLAASLSLISMILLGFLFVSLFLHSSRMYFNQLVDWTRMPFAVSQIFLPAIVGLPLILITMLPKIVLKIGLMQVCMIILLLPLMYRGRIYPEVQFDYKPRKIEIPWKWIISFLVISGAMVTALKFGIKIR